MIQTKHIINIINVNQSKKTFKLLLKPSSESNDLTLKIVSARDVETSVTNNSPSEDSNHPDDLFHSGVKINIMQW